MLLIAGEQSRAGWPATVVHMTTVHPADDIRIYVKQCRTLAAAGYRVHLIAPGARDRIVDGVQLHSVEPGRGSRVARMTGTVARLSRQAWALDADIYHFHDPELMPVGVLLRVAGKRVIYDAHEHLPWQVLTKPWIPRALRPGVATAVDRLERLGARLMSAVVTAEAPVAQRLAPIAKRTVIVGNYPIPDEFAADPDWSQKQRMVCYVGAITVIRGAREMVRAVGLTDGQLALAGHFSPPELEKELQHEPGWARVMSRGRVGRQSVVDMLAQSMAGLVVLQPVPNYTRAEPTKMYEYMLAGIPVIASSFRGWRDVLERHQCGICVDPTSPQAIGEAIQWMIDHPEEARRMGENGRTAARGLYSWNTERDKLLSLYADLLER
jgi:glycosyltransferase involved in cell wall biosynthesis